MKYLIFLLFALNLSVYVFASELIFFTSLIVYDNNVPFQLVVTIAITTTNVSVTIVLNATMVYVQLVKTVEEDVLSTVIATAPPTASTALTYLLSPLAINRIIL